jgi:flagellar hook-basal body complex protein FliE
MPTNAFAAGAYAAVQNYAALGGKSVQTGGAQGAAGTGGFGDLLTSALDGVSASGQKSEAQAVAAASGKANVVDVVTAVAESETALQTLVAVRDRVISAYEEIMRMQI